jgi:putative MATE family efflux protein
MTTPTIPTPPAAPRPGRLLRAWRAVAESLAGSDQDFTEGSLERGIVLLAVPMVLEMTLESVFAVCDVFFVSRLGPAAVATVGLTEAVVTLVFGVAIGLSMATTAMVARRIGEKDRDGAACAAVQAILLGIAVSVAFGAVGMIAAPRILGLMGADAEVVRVGSSYTAVLLGGTVTIVLLFLINAVFRGAGDAAIAMRVLWLANAVNLVLDPCLIFGLGPFPELGVTGAAVATTIGRGTGVVFQLVLLARGRGRVALRRSDLRLDLGVMARLVRVSLGGIFQFLIATASWLGLVRILAVFGSAALAGYTIAIRVIIFSILPSWGLSNAAATLVGQNLGAGKPDRATRAVWLTALYNVRFLGLVAVVFLLWAHPIVRLFTADPVVVRVGADCLRTISYGYVFYAFGMVIVQAFNGAGDTWTPTVINLCCYWLFQIPLAWALARPLGLGAHGVFLAIAIAESLIAVVGLAVFRLGRWKTRTV